MKKRLWAVLVGLMFWLLSVSTQAQEGELELSLSKDFGYDGLGGEIEGRFSLHASGPEGLVEVRFMVDQVVVAVDDEPPFGFQFDTGDYAPGAHTLTAIGILANGSTVRGPEIRRNFLSAEEARQATTRLIFPLLAVVGGLILLGSVAPLLVGRRGSYRSKMAEEHFLQSSKEAENGAENRTESLNQALEDSRYEN